MSRVRAVAILLVLSTAAPLLAQPIQARLPAGRTQKLGMAPGYEEAVVVVGVPGELSHLRFRPRPPYTAQGWELLVLQANQPTRTYAAGPHEAIDAGQVQFGLDGAVGVVVRVQGDASAGGRLRTTSRLPVGYLHPEVVATEFPAGLGAPDGLTMLSVATRLREGLDLRVRQWYPQGAGGIPGVYVEFSPEWIVTPPSNLAEPFALALEVPAFPWPATWLHAYQGSRYEHVEYSTEQAWLDRITARVRRRPPPSSKLPKGVACMPPPPDFWHPRLDAVEAQPGAHLQLDAEAQSPNCAELPVTKTLRVWLTSPHASGSVVPAGVVIAGPLEVELGLGLTPISVGIDLPADVDPGLYGVQLQVGTPGVAEYCGDALLKGPDRLLLRVLEP